MVVDAQTNAWSKRGVAKFHEPIASRASWGAPKMAAFTQRAALDTTPKGLPDVERSSGVRYAAVRIQAEGFAREASYICNHMWRGRILARVQLKGSACSPIGEQSIDPSLNSHREPAVDIPTEPRAVVEDVPSCLPEGMHAGTDVT
eukprot:960572-Prymnesium_polylepis.1